MKQKMLKRNNNVSDELTGIQFYYLVHGHCILDGDSAFRNDTEAKAAYFEHKDALFAKQAQKEHDWDNPTFSHGARPWGWWRWDPECPAEQRKQIAGNPVTPITTELYYGAPAQYTIQGEFSDIKFETEFDYLKRHNLLFDGELEKVKEERTCSKCGKFDFDNITVNLEGIVICHNCRVGL